MIVQLTFRVGKTKKESFGAEMRSGLDCRADSTKVLTGSEPGYWTLLPSILH
jgi:hypothetical protein